MYDRFRLRISLAFGAVIRAGDGAGVHADPVPVVSAQRIQDKDSGGSVKTVILIFIAEESGPAAGNSGDSVPHGDVCPVRAV